MYAYFMIPLGPPAVGGHLASCMACELTRLVREEVGPALPERTTDEELRQTAPKQLRVRGKRLRALHAEALERGGTDARHALLVGVLADLDEAWEFLPDYDRRTTMLFVAAIAVLVAGVFVAIVAGSAWSTAIAITCAVATTTCIVAATFSAITSRARDARKRLLPNTVKALAQVPFDEAEVEQVLAAGRENGSPVATARVLRCADLARRASAGAGPYR
jgi:hypothetical protein